MTALAIDVNLQEASNAFEEKSPDVGGGLSLLEHLVALSAMRCTNVKSPLLFGEDKVAKKAILIKVDCKLWSCKSCAARKVRKWIAKVVNGVNRIGGQWYFCTITAHENWRGIESSLKNLRQGWNKLYHRIKRAFGAFEYTKILEHHKDDSFHFHFIINASIPTNPVNCVEQNPRFNCKWLKDKARACGMGFKVDYQPLRSAAGAAYYVAKYVGKDLGLNQEKWPKNVHRIRTSNNWPELPDLREDTGVEWGYMEDVDHVWACVHIAEDNGFELYGNNGLKASPRELIRWFKQQRGETLYDRINDVKRARKASGTDDNVSSIGNGSPEGKNAENVGGKHSRGSSPVSEPPKPEKRVANYSAYFTESAEQDVLK